MGLLRSFLRRISRISGGGAIAAVCLIAAGTSFGQTNEKLVRALRSGMFSGEFQINQQAYSQEGLLRPQAHGKIDASLRLVMSQNHRMMKARPGDSYLQGISPYALSVSGDDDIRADVFIRTEAGFSAAVLTSLGATRIVEAGGIVSASVPLGGIGALAEDPNVRFIELAARRKPLNDAGRTDIRADLVHQGFNLPAAYKGEGVIVGVLDSGIDFTHPDFSDENGTRIQHLLEYTTTGQLEWSKTQIDTDPTSVTQGDLDDGGGHGTHVAGSATGGGKLNSIYTGVAPNADIIFVKGMIDGGFSDNAVFGGCQYIFEKADALGKPAVINLSLGSNFGPIDGSSLYEQALSNLTGPGKIIVAAAGNEGFDLIHAGAVLPASTQNVTLLISDNPSQLFINMWYTPGVISDVAIGAFAIDESDEPIYLGNTSFVPVGSFMNHTPLTSDEIILGQIGIDAQTTADPRNGDGNIIFEIIGDPDQGVDISEIIWVVIYNSSSSGRFDMWSFGGEFWPVVEGIPGVNEIPGDSHSTIGTPASAHKIIAVGSYVTKTTFTNIDNQMLQWRNPDPTRQTNDLVVPSIGQKSYFSSIGPTRDGRIAPDISAPGELIFSPLSSQLAEGTGYQRILVAEGGNYIGSQGTSMASPHVAGVVALMLQVRPDLTYEQTLDILRETARVDSWTGSVPNHSFGAGKIDAHAAVMNALGLNGGPGTPTTLRYFDPESEQRTWIIDTTLPIDSGFVFGTNRYSDMSKATAFSLPGGETEGRISEVKIWFSYRRDGLTDQTYSVEVFNGSASSGPTGVTLSTKEFMLANVNADADLQTPEQATVHTFDMPVSVGSEFFVSVNFGSYGSDDFGNAGIAATDQLGSRVPEVWEQWSDGEWHNLSDAWFGSGAAPGTGIDGWHMWMEVVLEGPVSVPNDGYTLPVSISLEQNYPNPFNPSTAIRYSIPSPSRVSLRVYDILGRVVADLINGDVEAGTHTVHFDGSSVSSGLYFYRLETDSKTIVRHMMLVK